MNGSRYVELDLPRRCHSYNVCVKIPKGWEYHSPAPADHSLDLRIGLKQDKIDELISSLYEVSDPSHSRYLPRISFTCSALITRP